MQLLLALLPYVGGYLTTAELPRDVTIIAVGGRNEWRRRRLHKWIYILRWMYSNIVGIAYDHRVSAKKKKITDLVFSELKFLPMKLFYQTRSYYSNSVHRIRVVGPLLQSREANACNHGIIHYRAYNTVT